MRNMTLRDTFSILTAITAILALTLAITNNSTPGTTTNNTTNNGGASQPRSQASFATNPLAGNLIESTFDNQTISPALSYAQCANTGTPSKAPRYRGTLTYTTTNPGDGTGSAVITLPTTPSGYSLTACNTGSPSTPIAIGSDSYQGLMIQAPSGYTTVPNSTGSMQLEEFHFQNVFGAPINWELHGDHVTLALHTGACTPHNQPHPTCAYRSDADAKPGGPNLPAYYVIPPGMFHGGQWYEIAMHVHWASDNTGHIQTFWRAKGDNTWTASADFSGHPTVQWDSSNGCCQPNQFDEMELYGAALRSPLSVSFDDNLAGSTLAAVEDAMPGPLTTTSSSTTTSGSTTSSATTTTTPTSTSSTTTIPSCTTTSP